MARRGRTTKVSVEVTPDTSRRLKILAAERGVTVTYLLTAMIERELAEAERQTEK
jgi:predicted DNA-binding protein